MTRMMIIKLTCHQNAAHCFTYP